MLQLKKYMLEENKGLFDETFKAIMTRSNYNNFSIIRQEKIGFFMSNKLLRFTFKKD